MSILPPYPWPHCSTGSPCTMGTEEGERCSCSCLPCRTARWGIARSGVYRPRWQWWFPWGVTRPWLPRAFPGGDEWCQVPLCVVVPPLGGIAVYPPVRRRVMPCAEDWGHMDDSQRAEYAPCGRYFNGRVNWDAHDHFDGPCEEAARWLETARAA